jgi:hypothetical protein
VAGLPEPDPAAAAAAAAALGRPGALFTKPVDLADLPSWAPKVCPRT